MSDRAGIDLNTVQIVASMGAAVTGAILTSYLGDGGTIMGTAVGSGVSTAGFAIYKHYLARTKEKVAPVIAGHARQWSPTTQASSRRAAAAGQTEARTAASSGRAVPSDDRTRPDRGQADPRRPDSLVGRPSPAGYLAGRPPACRRHRDDAGVRHRAHGRHRPQRPDGHRTVTGRDGHNGPAGRDGNGGPTGTTRPSGNGTAGGPGRHGRAAGGNSNGNGNGVRGRPRWLVMVASAAAVFLVAMLWSR